MKIITYSILLLFVASAVFADTERLYPSGDVSPDNFLTFDLAGEISAITDSDDNSPHFIFRSSGGGAERYSFGNHTIPAGVTVDSVIATFRSQKTGGGTTRQKIRVFATAGPSKYCTSGNFTMTTSWVNYSFTLTQAPSSAGACSDAWTRDLIDSVEVCAINAAGPSAGHQNRVSEMYLDVYFTTINPQIVIKD